MEGLYLRAHLLQMERSSQDRFRTASGERKHRHRSLDNHHPKYTLLFGERSEPRDSLIGAASFFLFPFSHLMLCTDRSLLIRSHFEQKQKPKIITFPLGVFALRILRTQIRSFEGDLFYYYFFFTSLISASGMAELSRDRHKSHLLFKRRSTIFKR